MIAIRVLVGRRKQKEIVRVTSCSDLCMIERCENKVS
jgi:hypothetical protein